ncbi:MAG: mechanosensitive ion channel family protein [Leptolyngbyaceae cyanobacterium SM2_5_2]|nr:mechanosensitive ion channel family protein [Leptolyngbyaceae cyanobacterium SM2_5_2]
MQRIGLLEVTVVTLDGTDLFEIASPMVPNRDDPGSLVPIEVRARQIEINLNQVVAQALNPTASAAADLTPDGAEASLIQVKIDQVNDLPVLFVVLNDPSEPKSLLTVTDSDAQYHGISKVALAEQWQGILQQALDQAVESRQPGALGDRLRQAGLIVLGSLLLSLVLWGLWRILGWRKQILESRQTAGGSQLDLEVNAQSEPGRASLPSVMRYQMSLQQRLQLMSFLRWLLMCGLVFVWISALASVLYLFPQTRRYASTLFSTPLLLLATWFAAGFLNRLANLSIDRIAQAWENNELSTLDNIQHKAMRVSTITRAVKGFKTAVIYVLAILLVLQLLELAPASLLAFGAVAALALSFAAQNLVKDLVNGFLILLEDQYAIGDLVTMGSTTGIVENLNLRITQIRGEDGRLVTLPNSLIAQVDNLSRTWSRAIMTINVAYGTDVNQALVVIRETAQAMAQDPVWRSNILDPTEMLGVEDMTHAGLTILLWIRTQPLKQFLVAREFRRRLRLAFEQEGIAIGIPQQLLSGLNEQEVPAEGL